MSVKRITLDTNILVYTLDARDNKKHRMATQIIERLAGADCVLTLQALSEFFNTIIRKNLKSAKEAIEHIRDLEDLFPTVTAKQTALKQAMDAVCNYKMAFWDAMLWAAARDAGVTLLLTEDFQHGQLLGGVRMVNPFIANEFWSL